MTRYHMQKAEREITQKDDILRIIAKGRFATLALGVRQVRKEPRGRCVTDCKEGARGALSLGDRPYAVTLNYGFDQDQNALYFHSARKGLKNDIIERDPGVCATIIEDLGYRMGRCSHAYRSVVINGTIRLIPDLQEKAHGLKVMMEHLEEDPEPLKEKYLTDEKTLAGVAIYRLDIEQMTGKEGK